MRVVLIFLTYALALMARTAAEIDLSEAVQKFPTNAVSVHGCNAAYDNPDRRPPASCKPFPVILEIDGVRPSASGKDRLVLAVSVKNVGDHPIELPKFLEETKGGRRETFISFEVYSLPESKTVKSVSYAFANSNNPSSVVHVDPGEAVIYKLPFDRQVPQENMDAAYYSIRVLLRAYSLEQRPQNSDEISNQLGNEIVSEPFKQKR